MPRDDASKLDMVKPFFQENVRLVRRELEYIGLWAFRPTRFLVLNFVGRRKLRKVIHFVPEPRLWTTTDYTEWDETGTVHNTINHNTVAIYSTFKYKYSTTVEYWEAQDCLLKWFRNQYLTDTYIFWIRNDVSKQKKYQDILFINRVTWMTTILRKDSSARSTATIRGYFHVLWTNN